MKRTPMTLRGAEALRDKAAQCRRLSNSIGNAETVATLKAMAVEYDDQASQVSRPH